MTTALLSPVDRTGKAAVQVAPRRYRKEILRKGTITYKGRKIDFDDAMMGNILLAYREGAVHQVPYQIADGENRHNNHPELFRGEVVDLVRSGNGGLDVVMDLTEQGEKLIKDNPNLGVSARIELGMQRATDGKVFPHVLQHVLGTVNPRVPGMKPWEKVELSSEDGATEVIDLSAETLDTTEENMGTTTAKEAAEEKVAVELSKADLEAFQEMLEDQKKAKELALSAPDGDEEDGEDGGEGDDPRNPNPAPLGLTAEASAAIELAKSTADAAVAQNLDLSNKLRAAQVGRDVDQYLSKGLAPAVVELARPLLELPTQAIELSNGNSVDPGDVVRKILSEVVDLSSTGSLVIDLGREDGVALAGTDSEVSERQAKLTAWDNEQY